MLYKAGQVPQDCGLQPILGGVRVSDYRDLINGNEHAKKLTGYLFCCFAMVINTVRSIPHTERLEIVFGDQLAHGPSAVLAMQAIARCSRWFPEMLTADGTPKLVKWGFAGQESTSLFEPADYFAYALLQTFRDNTSLRAQLCNPILVAAEYEGMGAILTKEKVRAIVKSGLLLTALKNAVDAHGEMGNEVFNWRIVVLCTFLVLAVALLIRFDSRGRFMLAPTSDGYPPFAIDTHTGRFCDPMPKGLKGRPFPKCEDLAKNWR